MTSRSINCSECLPQSAYSLDSNDQPCLQGQSVGWFTGLHSLQGWVSKPTAATLGMLRSMEFYQHLQGGEGRQLPVAVDGGWEGRPSQNILLLPLPRVWQAECLVPSETGSGKYLKYSCPPLLALQKQERLKQRNLLDEMVKAALLLLEASTCQARPEEKSSREVAPERPE